MWVSYVLLSGPVRPAVIREALPTFPPAVRMKDGRFSKPQSSVSKRSSKNKCNITLEPRPTPLLDHITRRQPARERKLIFSAAAMLKPTCKHMPAHRLLVLTGPHHWLVSSCLINRPFYAEGTRKKRRARPGGRRGHWLLEPTLWKQVWLLNTTH